MRRRTPTIATKLSAFDHMMFDAFYRMEGKTKTEVARDAILHFMEGINSAEMIEYAREMMDKLSRSKGFDLEWYAISNMEIQITCIRMLW